MGDNTDRSSDHTDGGDTIYADDLAVGDTVDFGSHTVTAEEITTFAEKYDPLPFHVDEAAAEESIYGGLIASGWHVVSLTNRMLNEALYGDLALLGGRGTDDVRFHRPTRPGDTLSGVVEVASKGPVDDERDRVDVAFAVETCDDEGRTILTMVNNALVRPRTDE